MLHDRPPATRPRRGPALALLAVLALLVAGCQVRIDTGIELREDDTAVVDLSVGIRFTEDLPPEATGGEEAFDPAEAQADVDLTAAACGFDAEAASTEAYESEDGFQGVTIGLDGIPIEAVNCFFTEGDAEDQLFESFEIARDGDEFTFEATLVDLQAQLEEAFSGGLGGELGGQKRREVAQDPTAPSAEDLEALASELEALQDGLSGLEDLDAEDVFEITVRMTFPGEVVEHDGARVEGTTVVWELTGDQRSMSARGLASGDGAAPADAEAGDGTADEAGAADDDAAADDEAQPLAADETSDGGSALPWILVGLAVLVALGLVLFLVLRGRKGSSTPPPALAPGGPPPGGAPPGQWTQQPQQPQQPPGQWGQQPQQPQQPPGQWGQQPQQPPGQWGQQPQQPQPPAPQAPAEGGGFNPDATRTFRPEDLLPPQDPPPGR